MAVFGSLIKGALGGYGDKPKVPVYNPVDPTAEALAAIEGNQANLPAAQKLAASTNAFNLAQLQQMLRTIMPGYDNIQGKQSEIVQSMMRGEIPQDVQSAIVNQAASKAIGGGYGGSGAHRNLVARDFGKTSYDITQQGMDSAQRWMAQTAQMAQPSMMDVTSMFISPQQRIAYQFQNRENQFNRDWMANQIKAAPDPFMAALGDAFIQDEQFIQDVVKEVAGSAGGAAMMCWVARTVYPEDNVKWRLFRRWLLRIAPKWFRNLYLRHGERFSKWISNKPTLKAIIRRWMDRKVEMAYGTI
jgi:hypothetical protein